MARIILLVLCVWSGTLAFAQKNELQLFWKFEHLDPAYARMARLQVIVDDTLTLESGSFSMNEIGSFFDSLSVGKHRLELRILVRQIQGWELHTVENDYSMDVLLDTMIDLRSDLALHWELDVVAPSTRLREIPLKLLKSNSLKPLDFHTRFTSVPDGYDHLSRIRIYGNGRLLATGKEIRLSEERWEQLWVPFPIHDLRVVIEVNFRGEWEEHNVFNGYQFDLIWCAEKLKRSRNVYWNGDIESGYLYFEETKKGLPR